MPNPNDIELRAGGHTLYGERDAAGWHWQCDSWPYIARAHDGDLTPGAAVLDFLARSQVVTAEMALQEKR